MTEQGNGETAGGIDRTGGRRQGRKTMREQGDGDSGETVAGRGDVTEQGDDD